MSGRRAVRRRVWFAPAGILAAVLAGCSTPVGSAPTSTIAPASTVPTASTGTVSTAAATAADVVLKAPEGVAVDHVGNVFVADFPGELIIKVTPGGDVSHFAGTGVAGMSDDGTSSLSAQFREPSGLAWGTFGGLLVADHHNQRIWRIASDVVRLVAGSGPAGQGAGGFAGDGGPATNALLNEPLGLAMDRNGAIFIGDSFNHRVRRVSRDGIIETVLGGGTKAVGSKPIAGRDANTGILGYVTLDERGNLYVSERSGNPSAPGGARILRLAADGSMTVFGGTNVPGFGGDGGPATAAQLNDPNGLAVDSARNLLVCDSENLRIRRIAPDGVITTVAGTGEPGLPVVGNDGASSAIGKCFGLAIDADGNVWAALGDTGQVVEFDRDWMIAAVYGGSTP
jgi:sugar lactone lactonase YvrE